MSIWQKALVLASTAIVVGGVGVVGVELQICQTSFFLKRHPRELVDEAWQIVNQDYVDGTFNHQNWPRVRQQYLSRTYANLPQAYGAIRSLLATLRDPYTRFMDPTQFRDLTQETSGELVGIGIEVVKNLKTHQLMVVMPLPGSPAAAAGILPQDVITEINHQPAAPLTMAEATNLIRGPRNSLLVLTVERGGHQLTFTLKRRKIRLQPVRFSYRSTPAGPIGYIRLSEFSANATPEMSQAISTLKKEGVKGYILDLRANPGGLLLTSIAIARLWINQGVILTTVNRWHQERQVLAQGTALTSLPLVVLVDGGSASSSEILAGALQDDHRACLVGTQTFGKGLVQSVLALGDGSGMAVTVEHYLTPNGQDINRKGITPQVVIPLSWPQQRLLALHPNLIGTGADPQYTQGLQILRRELVTQACPALQQIPG